MLPRLVQAIMDRASESPYGLALAFSTIDEDKTKSLTWAELCEEVARAAAILRRADVGDAQPLLILTSSTYEQVISFLAGLWVGAVPSILSYPSLKQTRTTFLETFNPIVQTSGARWVICGDLFRDLVDEHKIRILSPPTGSDVEAVTTLPPSATYRFLQFSSGTTGLRKGVVITEAMLNAQADAYGERLALSSTDVFVSWLPLYHDMGLVGAFLLPLFHGLPSVHLSPFEWLRHPDSYLRAIDRYQGTISFLPNFAYTFLADRVSVEALAHEQVSLASLRLLINCSEPVRAAAHREFVRAFSPLGLSVDALQACYAMAEGTFAVTQTPVGIPPVVDRIDREAFQESLQCQPASDDGEYALEFVSCGTPIRGVDIRIDGTAAERRVGEIEIRGAYVIDRYFGTAGDAPVDTEGWFKTGDLGYVLNGNLFVTGRVKDLIIHRGVNLWPCDIEEVIGSVEGCKAGRVVVFGVPDEALGTEDVVAVVELDASNARAPSDVERNVRECVTKRFDIRLRDVVTSGVTLKKSTSGKLSRGATRQAYLDRLRNRPLMTDIPCDDTKYYKLSDALSVQRNEDTVQFTLPTGEGFSLPIRDAGQVAALREIPRTLFAIKKFAREKGFHEVLEKMLALNLFVEQGSSDYAFDQSGFVAFLARPESRELVIQFRGGWYDVVDGVPAPAFATATGIGAHNLLMLRDQSAKSYLCGISENLRTFEDVVAWLRGTVWTLTATMGIRQIHCLGTSMGAFAALLAGHALRAQNVWAFSPTIPDEDAYDRLLNALGSDNGVTAYRVWFGEKNERDQEVAEALRHCAGVSLHPVPTDSHLIALEMWRNGKLPVLMDAPPAKPAEHPIPAQSIDLESIIDALQIVVGPNGKPIHRESSLVGLLDSFDVTRLFSLLEKRFGIEIDLTAVTQPDMQTPEHLLSALRRIGGSVGDESRG